MLYNVFQKAAPFSCRWIVILEGFDWWYRYSEAQTEIEERPVVILCRVRHFSLFHRLVTLIWTRTTYPQSVQIINRRRNVCGGECNVLRGELFTASVSWWRLINSGLNKQFACRYSVQVGWDWSTSPGYPYGFRREFEVLGCLAIDGVVRDLSYSQSWKYKTRTWVVIDLTYPRRSPSYLSFHIKPKFYRQWYTSDK